MGVGWGGGWLASDCTVFVVSACAVGELLWTLLCELFTIVNSCTIQHLPFCVLVGLARNTSVHHGCTRFFFSTILWSLFDAVVVGYWLAGYWCVGYRLVGYWACAWELCASLHAEPVPCVSSYSACLMNWFCSGHPLETKRLGESLLLIRNVS